MHFSSLSVLCFSARQQERGRERERASERENMYIETGSQTLQIIMGLES